ncbi:glycosyltransferase [Sphingomonas sp. CJ20]
MSGFEVRQIGVGGALIRWLRADGAPRHADLFSGAAHVLREAILPLDLGALPALPPQGEDTWPALSILGLLRGGASTIADDADGYAWGLVPLGALTTQFAPPYAVFDGVALAPLVQSESALPAPAATAGVSVSASGGYLLVAATRRRPRGEDSGPIYIVIDGRIHACAMLSCRDGDRGVLVTLPAELLDGERHWIEVRDGVLGETLHAGEHVFDAIATPGAALQTHTNAIERPGLVPFAELRYQGLVAALGRLAALPDAAPDWLAVVSACHQYVLRGPQPNQRRFEPRRVHAAAQPDFSIVIPVHDKFYFTYFAINAVLYTAAGLSYELILVDDGSSDRTLDAAAIFPGIRVVRHEAARGFVDACNAGAAVATGKHIVLLNNDTEPLGRWLEELRFPFTAFDAVAVTGARLIYPDGRLQEAGGIVWGNGKPWNYGRGGNPAEPRFNYTRQADYVSGAAIMIARDVWEALGGFPERYAPGYYEDTDLAFAVRAKGMRCVYAAKATVIHHEGVTSGTDRQGGMKRFQDINRPKFEERWRRAFAQHGVEGVSPDLEKDRGIIGRVLVLDYQSPRFDRDAGSFAISQEMRMFQALGYKVTIAPLNCAHLGMYTDAYERAGIEHLYAPFYTSLADVIDRRGAEFDLVYIHRFGTAAGLIPRIRQRAPKAKIVLNCADVHFLRELRAARLAESSASFAKALKTRDAEVAVFRQCDAVLTYSDVERGVIESYLGLQANVRILPWIAEPVDTGVLERPREGIAFLGSYDHQPNRDAVEFFLAECWPEIRARNPGVTFHIAGSGFDAMAQEIADDRVVIEGWVEDAAAFLAARAIMVAPLRIGAGMKGKVIDALRVGTPCVLSGIAAEGMRLEDGVATIADTPADWVEQVTALLASEARRRDMAQRSLDFVERHFSEAHAQRALATILASVGLPHAIAPENMSEAALVQRRSMREQARLFDVPSLPVADKPARRARVKRVA